MAAPRIDRTERLLNLVFALMGSDQPVSRASIAAAIPGYDPSAGQAAFERMFERDKDELRGLGIPIRTVLDVNGDVAGYTIDRDDYALPEISFDAAERSALSLAASAWQNALVKSSALAGLRKLESDPLAHSTPAAFESFVARINDGETHLLPLMSLLRARASVTFEYQSPQASEASVRHVDPWGVVAQEGGWYLVGHDRGRDAVRSFRLSRMTTAPKSAGSISVPAPRGIDLRGFIDPAARSVDRADARIRVRAGAAARLRRMSETELPFDIEGELCIDGVDRSTLISDILFSGDGVVGIEPEDLRNDVIAALTGIREAHAGVRS